MRNYCYGGKEKFNKMFLVTVISAAIILADGFATDELCEISIQQMTCQNDFPKIIPPGVSEVFVRNHKNIVINRSSFSDTSWKSVLNFQIFQNEEKTHSVSAYSNAFKGLDNLNVLGIHTRGFTIRGSKLFHGLENITELDFSGCVNLDSAFIVSTLRLDGNFSKLRSLNLDEVKTNLRDIGIHFDKNFTDMLIEKQIERLSLGKTSIILYSLDIVETSYVTHLNLPEITFYLNGPRNDISSFILDFFTNLKSLNITQIFPWFWRGYGPIFSNVHITNCEALSGQFITDLFFIEHLYANDILTDVSIAGGIVKSSFNFSCGMNLRTLELRGNNFGRIEANFGWPKKNFLQYIDLSNNKLVSVSQSATAGLNNLQTLLLADNMLSKMSSSSAFIELFENCEGLKTLVLDNNGFTYLPENIFRENKFLSYLSIKDNQLKQIMFRIDHLKELEHLDISNNEIRNSDKQSLNYLTNLMRTQPYFTLNLDDNPIECSCESVSFIDLISKHVLPKLDKGTMLKCTLENKLVDINDETVAKTRLLCIRTLVYIGTSCLAFVVIVTSAVVSIMVTKYVRRRRSADQVERFLKSYRKKEMKEKFICLLSYSNADSEIVMEHIYEKMNATFKKFTGVEADTVCIDDRHFRAGAKIVAEIMGCVQDSCVIVFVVSRSFCQSNWCCLEIREAYEQQKPILLMFSEEVDESEMPDHVKKMFQRYTRAKLVKQDEDIIVKPGGWEGLGESVILLASKQFAEQKTKTTNTIV